MTRPLRPRARGSRPRSDSEGVLDAAERVFAANGFAGAKMQDIATRARVSLRSVYDVARGKDRLYRRVNEARARDLLARIERTSSQATGSAADELMDVIEVVVGFLMQHRDFLRIQLREGGAWGLEEVGRQTLVAERHESDRRLELLFRRGIREGVFHDEDPRVMVASLRAQEQVVLAAWLSGRGRRSKRAALEAVKVQARRLFCL